MATHVKKKLSDNDKASGNVNADCQTTLGLAEVMDIWIRAQRKLDLSLDNKNLTKDQVTFWDNDKKKNGCIMPPSLTSMPEPPYKIIKAYGLNDSQMAEITSCLGILRSSYFPWAYQYKTGTHQHSVNTATGVVQLQRDKDTIFKHYLGENTIWKLYSTILDLVCIISADFMPWHGVIHDNRQENNDQLIQTTTLDQEDIIPIFGAGMASTASTINQRYQGGINKLIKLVHSVAAHEVQGQTYISRDVNRNLLALLRVSVCNIQQFTRYCKFTNNIHISVSWSGMCPPGLFI